MKLTIDKIREMNVEDIYEELEPMIDGTYQSFKNVMPLEEYKKIVLKIIALSKKVYKDDILYSEFIENSIKNNIAKIIKKNLHDSSKSFLLINRFVDSLICSDITIDKAIGIFKELDKLFIMNSFIPDLDFIIKLLIINKKLNDITKIIFKYYKYQVVSGTIQEVITNETLLTTLHAYCMRNNIEIKENEGSDELLSLDLKSPTAMYIDEVARYPVLTPEQERELAILISQGDEKARKKFIEHNLKLVINVAKRYRHDDFTLLDLIQEGNVGLIRAVDEFDINKGYKFSSYAPWWIRQSINRAIANKGKNIRVPVHLHEKLSLYNKVYENLNNKLQSAPKLNELANEMGLPKSKIIELIKISDGELSLNNPIDEEESQEFSGFVTTNEDSLEDTIIDSFLRKDVNELLKKCNLTPKELDVLKMRFGFDDKKPATLDEIGKKYHITIERVRQISARIRCFKNAFWL